MIVRILFVLIVFAPILQAHTLFGKVRLPQLVSDNMVIQRDKKVKIWGWADANEKVSVRFRGRSYAATANGDGSWYLWLPAYKAGGPYSMRIAGKNDTITIENILIGDVWLCAGQSNMVHYLELHQERYSGEITTANYPDIRQFTVPSHAVLTGPAKDLSGGEWVTATSDNILRFSVVAYFFAKNLHEKYGVPIGIINASVGGTPIEAWTSEEGLQSFPGVLRTIAANKDTAMVNRRNREAGRKARVLAAARPDDLGTTGPQPWYDANYKPVGWDRISIPGYWEDQGLHDLNGVVWYRKEIEVPASMTGVQARIAMGRIVDADHVYVNGTLIGNKTYQYPQRRYDVPPGLLRPGKNVLTIRVANYGGKGGFVPDKPYYLAAAGDTISLAGYWQYKIGAVYPRQAPGGGGISAQNQPGALYNGMLAPFTNHALKGFVWYQGESNTGEPEAYGKLLPALIADWRQKWGDLPFLYAQLPNFMDVKFEPSESQWAELREAQRKSLRVPNTGMAVAIDLGEWNDIHPDNKKPLGDRLALAAQKLAYHDNTVVYSGPHYTSANLNGNRVFLTFDHVGSGLVVSDGETLNQFAIASEDKRFVWANATIEGNQVVVWNDRISHPAYIRYAWADNPEGANLYNKEGLPASPFEAQVADLSKLWHGRKAAVVLTYDDALDVHLDNVIPVLDSLGFKGSFYLTAASPGSKNRVGDWKRIARNGHELGNHTLYHPCDGSKPGRSWVSPQNDLSKYTTDELTREIEMTNIFLESLDGKKERTFAYPCGDVATGEGSYIDAIKNQFLAMRGVSPRLNQIETIDLTNLNCYAVDDSNADQLILWAEKAKEDNGLLILLFHGVGGGHNLNVDQKKHDAFLSFLKNNEGDYWVTTLLEASKHCIKQMKNE